MPQGCDRSPLGLARVGSERRRWMIGVPQAGDDVVEIESIAVAMGDAGLGVDPQAVPAVEVLDGRAV